MAVAETSAVMQLTVQEKLLLSQAVYKLGAVAWPVVSRLLLEHPCCVGRPDDLFSPEACERDYMDLMKEVGQNVPAPDGMKPRAKSHLHLARTFYLARMEELKSAIKSYEERFTSLIVEINAIKVGQMDVTIQAELRAVLARKYGKKLLDSWVPPPEAVQEAVEAGPVDEAEVDREAKETEIRAAELAKQEDDVEMEDAEEGRHDEEKDVVLQSGDAALAVTETPVAEPDSSVEDTPANLEAAGDEGGELATESTPAVDHERNDTDPSTAPEFPAVTASPPVTESPAATVPLAPTGPTGTEEAAGQESGRTASAPASDLSPAPPIHHDEAETDSPAAETSNSTRTRKRKASLQPKGAPVLKRSTRHSMRSPAQADEPDDVPESALAPGEMEVDAIAEEEQPVSSTRGRRAAARRTESHTASTPRNEHSSPFPNVSEADAAHGADTAQAQAADAKEQTSQGRPRRSTARGRTGQLEDTLPTPTRPKDASPAHSRRALSMLSATSPNPPEEPVPQAPPRRGRPPNKMRVEVISKSVREETAESMKKEQQEDASSEEGEKVKEDAPVEEVKTPNEDAPQNEDEPQNENATPIDGAPQKEDASVEEAEKQSAPAEAAESEARPALRSGRRSTRGAIITPVATEKEEIGRRGGRRATKTPLLTEHVSGGDEAPIPESETVAQRERRATRDSVSSSAANSVAIPSRLTRLIRHMSPKEVKQQQRLLNNLLDAVGGHRNGSVFQNPVKKTAAPNYYEIIKRPMDLKKIRARIRDGQIGSIDEFERDVLLMFANGMMYNGKGSQVFEMAEEMLRESENQIAHFRTVQDDLGR